MNFTHPRPTENDIRQFYSGDYHADLRVPGGSERALGARYRQYVAWIRRFIDSGRVLDVGCSTGFLLHLLHQTGFHVQGLEPNGASAAWGTLHYGVPITVGTLPDLESAAGTFDLVIMADVVEHTASPLDTLLLARTKLNAGGLLLVTFPDIQSVEAQYLYWTAKAVRRPSLWRTCHIPHHTWEFTRPTAEALFRKAGFEVLGFRRSLSTMHEPRRLVRLLHAPVRLLGAIPWFGRRIGAHMEFMLRKPSPQRA